MANNDLPLNEWEETINKMSLTELQEYITDPQICYPEFLDLAKKRLTELESQKESEKKENERITP